MRAIKFATLFVAGLLASTLIAEGMFRTLPVTMGLYRTERQDLWPLHGYGPKQRYSYSLTWQMLFPQVGMSNNYGQIAPFDYRPGAHPVVVIGDSFIESQMNPYPDTLQGELDRLLDGRVPVYGFGFAGNSLAEYLALASLTKNEFAPVAMVFLIIHNDVKESWTNRIGHHYFEIGPGQVREGYQPLSSATTAQKVRRLFGDSALYRYIQTNLGFTVSSVFEKHAPVAPESQVELFEVESKSRRAIDHFLRRLPAAAGLPAERLFLVFDSDRGRIYDPARGPRRTVDSRGIQDYFLEQARIAGFPVIDTQGVFAEHFGHHRRRFDYQPVDSHWNGLGHRVVAQRVYEQLIGERQKGKNHNSVLRDTETEWAR